LNENEAIKELQEHVLNNEHNINRLLKRVDALELLLKKEGIK